MKSATATRIDACTQRDPVTGFCFMPHFTDKPVRKFQPRINSVKRRFPLPVLGPLGLGFHVPMRDASRLQCLKNMGRDQVDKFDCVSLDPSPLDLSC